MSLDRCSTCKFCVYCDSFENAAHFRSLRGHDPEHTQVATLCPLYESLSSAAAYEWDLRDLTKLWTTVEQHVPTE